MNRHFCDACDEEIEPGASYIAVAGCTTDRALSRKEFHDDCLSRSLAVPDNGQITLMRRTA